MADAMFDHSGSSFDAFLAEQDLLDEAEAFAIQRLIAWQLAEAMRALRVSVETPWQNAWGRAGCCSTGDTVGGEVHFATLTRAARVMGKMLRVEVVDAA